MGKRRQRTNNVIIPENGNGLDHDRVGAAASLLQLAELSAHRTSQSQNSRNILNMVSSTFTPSSVKDENTCTVSSSSSLPATNSNHLHFSQSMSAALLISSSSFSAAISCSANSVVPSSVDVHLHTSRMYPRTTSALHPHTSSTHPPDASDVYPHTSSIHVPDASDAHPHTCSNHPHTSSIHSHTSDVHPHTSSTYIHMSSIHPHNSEVYTHTASISPHTSDVHLHTSSNDPYPIGAHTHTADVHTKTVTSGIHLNTSNTLPHTPLSSFFVQGSSKSTPSPSPLVAALTSQTNYSQFSIRSDNQASALNLAISATGSTVSSGKDYPQLQHQPLPGNGLGNHDNADATNSPQTNTSSIPSPLDHHLGPSSASSSSSSSLSSVPPASLVASLTQIQLLAQRPRGEAAVVMPNKPTSSLERGKSSSSKKGSRSKRSSPADPKRVDSRRRTNSFGSDDGPTKKKAYIPSYVQEGEKCVVCNDNSTGTHYRAMTCEGCKGFFRRTIQNNNQLKYTCKFQMKCVIDKNNRNQCQACRFQKCIDAKMDPESVLSEPERKSLRFLIASNRKERKKKTNMVLTPEESEALALIGENFVSPRMSAFFTFFPDLNKEQHKPRMEDVQASIEHLVRFINCLPGVETEIIPSDVLALMHSRILDIVAFRLAYCFDLSTNELVMENRRISEAMLEQYTWMERIFFFAKFYARFTTDDGIVLGTLCAIRFFNTDNIPLTNDVAVNNVCCGLQLMLLKFISTEKRSIMHKLFSNLPNFENIRQEDTLILIRLSMLDSYSRRIPDDQLEVESERGEPDENGKKEKVTIQLSPYIIDLNKSSKVDFDGTSCPAADRAMGTISDRSDLVATVSCPRTRDNNPPSGPREENVSDSQSISLKSGSGEATVDDDCKIHKSSVHSESPLLNDMRIARAPIPSPISISGSIRFQPSVNAIGSTVTQPRIEPQALNGLAREQQARIVERQKVTQRLTEGASHPHALSNVAETSPSSTGQLISGNGQVLDLRNGESSQMLRSEHGGGLTATDKFTHFAESPNLSLEDLRRPRPPIGLNQLEIMDHLIRKNKLLEERLKEYIRNERAKEIYQEQQQQHRMERNISPFLEDLHHLQPNPSQRYEAEEQVGQQVSHREVQELFLSQNRALPLTVQSNRSHSSPNPQSSRFTSLDTEDHYQSNKSFSHEIHPISRGVQHIPDGATQSALLPLSNRAQVSSHPPSSSTLSESQNRIASSILSILQNPSRGNAQIPTSQNPVSSFSNSVSETFQPLQFGVTHQSNHPDTHVVHLPNTPSQTRHFLKHKDQLNDSPSHLSSDYPGPHDLSISSISAVPYTHQPLERNSMVYRPEEPRGHLSTSPHLRSTPQSTSLPAASFGNSHLRSSPQSASLPTASPNNSHLRSTPQSTSLPNASPDNRHLRSPPQSTSLPTASFDNSQQTLFKEVVSHKTEGNLPLPAKPTPAEGPSPTGYLDNGSERRGSFSTPSPDVSTSHRGLKKRWLVRHSTEGNSSSRPTQNNK